MKRCILIAEHNTGARVFFYDHPKTEFPDFDKESVRLYYSENDKKPFLRCHISQIIEIPDTVSTDKICGMTYPDFKWFHSIKDEWDK